MKYEKMPSFINTQKKKQDLFFIHFANFFKLAKTGRKKRTIADKAIKQMYTIRDSWKKHEL
jgi:hypothetical protein